MIEDREERIEDEPALCTGMLMRITLMIASATGRLGVSESWRRS